MPVKVVSFEIMSAVRIAEPGYVSHSFSLDVSPLGESIVVSQRCLVRLVTPRKLHLVIISIISPHFVHVCVHAPCHSAAIIESGKSMIS